LELRDATVAYEDFLAINDLSLKVAEGTIHAIIGPNGAGKSTLFGVITGEKRLTRGSILLRGTEVTGRGSVWMARAGVVKMFQSTSIFERATVRDALRVAVVARQGGIRHAGIRRTARVEREVESVLVLLGLEDKADAVAGELSLGDQRVVELGMCLAAKPSVLLLDEPTAGMSHSETDRTVTLLKRMNRDTGVTVVLSEHDMEVIFGLADRITVIAEGSILCDGTADQVRNNSEVKRMYFG
jgi:branched-chain amino acid transport system ATP-binding protein